MDEQIEYLKNELRSYNTMKKWIDNDSYIFHNRIKYYEKKIKEIDIELNAGNAKGIDYNYVPSTGVREPLLQLLAEQEKYINRRDELIRLMKEDSYGIKARVEFIDRCLDSLDEDWKRIFVIEYYCNRKSIDKLIGYIPRSRSSLNYDKENILREML